MGEFIKKLLGLGESEAVSNINRMLDELERTAHQADDDLTRTVQGVRSVRRDHISGK